MVREFMSVMINVSVSHRKRGKRVMLLASRSYRSVKVKLAIPEAVDETASVRFT